MKVLIVDDSRAMRMIVRRALRQAGFDNLEVQEAADGAEALQMAIASSPELILSDWNMPVMSGIQLLDGLIQAGSTSRFGFVTSESTPEMKAKALEAGALFLITKPFSSEAFQDALEPLFHAHN